MAERFKTVYKCTSCFDTFWLWKNVDFLVTCKKCGQTMERELYEVVKMEENNFWGYYSANFPVSAYGVFAAIDVRRIFPVDDPIEITEANRLLKIE